MEKKIKSAQEGIDAVSEFIFSIKRFLNKNPQIKKEYNKFLNEKENMIY